jgi:hypothetical protein
MVRDEISGMALPEGARRGPNCAVTAMAVMLGVDFPTMFELCRGNRSKQWQGVTVYDDYVRAAKALGWELIYTQPNRKANGRRRVTLRTFVKHMPAGQRLMIRVGGLSGHMVVVKDKIVLDQGGMRHIILHPAKNRTVSGWYTFKKIEVDNV